MLPFPGSLLFWGAPFYRELQRELPLAMQIPLLHLFGRYHGSEGLRVPQSGWLNDHPLSVSGHVPMPQASHFRRTNRQQKMYRDQDPLALPGSADHITRALFGTRPSDLGLYDKPLARNAQVWNAHYHLLLDGPPRAVWRSTQRRRSWVTAASSVIASAGRRCAVGPWEVYWHYPLAAFPSQDPDNPVVLEDEPLGYLTAYRANDPDPNHAIELWPRLLRRPAHQDAVDLFPDKPAPGRHHTVVQIRSLLDYFALLGDRPLPRSFAQALLLLNRGHTLEDWLTTLPDRAGDRQARNTWSES